MDNQPGYSVDVRESRRFIGTLVFVAALGIALLSARDYAGSWSDGSQLASVESLVDYHSLVVGRSIFVKVPREPGASPYGDDPLLNRNGTRDVLLIAGQYYSAKPPIPLPGRGGPIPSGISATIRAITATGSEA